MTAIYKNNWIDKYPVTDIPYWADELSDRTDAQIAWGLRHMKQAPNYETWPPNLLEFRKLCVISLRDLELAWPDESFGRAIAGTGTDLEMKVFRVTGPDFAAFEACFREVRNQYLRMLMGLPHNTDIARALDSPRTPEVAEAQIAKMKEILG